MSQLTLMPLPVAPDVPGIDLRCCGVDDLLAEVRGARLVHADPPWMYEMMAGGANPHLCGIYSGLTMPQIVEHLSQSAACVDAGRLVCWFTWPKDEEWRDAGQAGAWGKRVTGGAWVKTGPKLGVGFHWRGQSEPIAVFTKGSTGRPNEAIRNEHRSDPTIHSEKPVEWLREMVRAWTDPGDLVLDLYAGMAPMARACALEGRRYVGAEIDPERHRAAMDRLHMAIGGAA